MTHVEFVVPGTPVSKARPRVVLRRGRVRTFTPATTRSYERTVALLAQAAGARPTKSPVRVHLRIYLPNARRVDIDNLAKAILDGLNGVAFADDSQVCDLRVEKDIDRAHPRAWVRIEEFERSVA